VKGGGDLLSGECRRLLIGQALKADPVEPYEPNNSGFGNYYKAGRKPEPIGEGKAS